jgi:HK97 family phage portal protein
MGILKRVASFFDSGEGSPAPNGPTPIDESTRSQATPSSSLGSSLSLASYNTTPRYGTQQVVASYGTNPNIRDVVGGIAYSVASTRWLLYSIRGKRPKSRAIKHAGVQSCGTTDRWELLRSLANDGRLTEIEAHPVLDLLAKANPQITGFSARKVTQTSLDLTGEMFWLLTYGASKVPVTYRPIPPQWIQSLPQPDLMMDPGQLQKIARSSPENQPKLNVDNAYKITINGHSALYPQWEIIWGKDPDPLDPYGRGIGIGQTLGDEIETDEFAAKFIKNFFVNGGRPELIVSLEKATRSTLEAARAKFEGLYGRYSNAHKTFWHDGKMEVKELTGKICDMQYVELRKAQRDTIGTTFHVPPEQRGIIENSKRSTIEGSDYIYQSKVIVPRLEHMRSELQYKLIPLYDDRLVLDFVSPVPEDKEYRLNVMRAAPHTVTRAEWRKEAGLIDRGEGDDLHHTPQGLVVEPAPKIKQRLKKSRSIGQIELFGVEHADDTLSNAALEKVLAQLKETPLVEHTIATQEGQLEWWGNAQMDALGVSARFDMQSTAVQEFLRDYSSAKIKYINDTTRANMRLTLLKGVQRGEGHIELSERVAEEMGEARGYRTNRIAATEARRAANFATQESFEESGVVEKKKWTSVIIGSRTQHIRLHGEAAIGLDEYFTIDDDKSKYPGGFERPENSINCQCYLQPELIKLQGERAVKEEHDWTAFIELTQPWVDKLGRAFIAGFNEQEMAVMKALKENMK